MSSEGVFFWFTELMASAAAKLPAASEPAVSPVAQKLLELAKVSSVASSPSMSSISLHGLTAGEVESSLGPRLSGRTHVVESVLPGLNMLGVGTNLLSVVKACFSANGQLYIKDRIKYLLAPLGINEFQELETDSKAKVAEVAEVARTYGTEVDVVSRVLSQIPVVALCNGLEGENSGENSMDSSSRLGRLDILYIAIEQHNHIKVRQLMVR